MAASFFGFNTSATSVGPLAQLAERGADNARVGVRASYGPRQYTLKAFFMSRGIEKYLKLT